MSSNIKNMDKDIETIKSDQNIITTDRVILTKPNLSKETLDWAEIK